MSYSRPPLLSQLSLRPLVSATLAALLALTSLHAQASLTTGAMNAPRMYHQSSAMHDGRVLLTGGYTRPGTAPYASAEIYDPASGTFTAVAPMQQARVEHAAVTLNDGRVLVVGGSIQTNPALVGTNSAEIFDPATGLWSATGNMHIARSRAMARVLPDGKVFVMNSDGYSGTNYAEVYDPQTGVFTKTGNVLQVTGEHGLVVLADGRVMRVGGYYGNYLKTAEIWNPATNQWSATGQMLEERKQIQPVLLPDGKVLVAGGSNSMDLKTSEIYDPATGLFTAGGAMPEAANIDSVTKLANGNFLMTVPYRQTLVHYQTGTGAFNVTGPTRSATRASSVSALPGGQLLLTGGSTLNDATAYAALWDTSCAPRKITLQNTAMTAAGDGGTVGFGVWVAAGCRFEATDLPAWLTLATPTPLRHFNSSFMTVNFTAAANVSGAWREASFMLGNNPATLSQPTSPTCPSMPSLASIPTHRYYETDGTLTVSAAATCPWSITSLPSWVTPTSATSGTGSGTVSYRTVANSGVARSGNGQLVALGSTRSFTMSQEAMPLCVGGLQLTNSNGTFPASGGSGRIDVAAAASCPWTVSGLPAWVTVPAGTGGTGPGGFNFTVAANTSTARSGSGSVNGSGAASSFNLSQAASPCTTWSISPTSVSMPAAGATGSLTVTADSSCSWSLSALPAWMTASSGTSGTGNGSISYTVAANAGAARSATATMSGSGPARSVFLSQAASPCMAWSISPASLNFAAAGTTGSLAVTADNSCSWSLSALPAWMTTSSATSGAGNASIAYTVAANTGAARSATATMTGSGPAKSVSLNQATGIVVVCSSTPIGSGVPANGMLQTSACTNGARGAGYYTDRYTFTGAPGQVVTILLTAPGFDTYLYLKNPGGTVIKSDDDGGGGTNSRIPASSGSFTLPAGTGGTYTIEVTSYSQYKTGAYTLSLTQ